MLKGVWWRRQIANMMIEVFPQMFIWTEIRAFGEPGKNFEVLIMLFQPCADTSSHEARCIILLEDPILPR